MKPAKNKKRKKRNEKKRPRTRRRVDSGKKGLKGDGKCQV